MTSRGAKISSQSSAALGIKPLETLPAEVASPAKNLHIESPSPRPASLDAICAALKSDEKFPEESVPVQLVWLCQRGGLQTLSHSAFRGSGSASLTEYFSEHDKTLYYGVGFRVDGLLGRLQKNAALFCTDFEQLRTMVQNRGFGSVKRVNISVQNESSCEYLQTGTSEWGLNPDLKAVRHYGVLETMNVYWRVERMVAPLNYSPVRQFSGLFLAWPDQEGVQGVYLIKVQNQVGGALMSTMRTRWKSVVSGTAEATAFLSK